MTKTNKIRIIWLIQVIMIVLFIWTVSTFKFSIFVGISIFMIFILVISSLTICSLYLDRKIREEKQAQLAYPVYIVNQSDSFQLQNILEETQKTHLETQNLLLERIHVLENTQEKLLPTQPEEHQESFLTNAIETEHQESVPVYATEKDSSTLQDYFALFETVVTEENFNSHSEDILSLLRDKYPKQSPFIGFMNGFYFIADKGYKYKLAHETKVKYVEDKTFKNHLTTYKVAKLGKYN